MNITSVNNLTDLSNLGVGTASPVKENRNTTFENLFQSAIGMVNDTNNLSNAAQQAEMSYSLGLNDNTHEVQVAQEKANLSLQYTVAVRNQVLDAYKEIMNLQF